jgi:hypothetical protein
LYNQGEEQNGLGAYHTTLCTRLRLLGEAITHLHACLVGLCAILYQLDFCQASSIVPSLYQLNSWFEGIVVHLDPF